MHAAVKSLAIAYLSIEGVSLVAYWVLLAIRPELRAPFVPPGGDERSLFAFAFGDLLLYAATGFAGAWAIARGRRWRGACLWLHAGAAAYAALFAVTLWPMDPSRWLGALMMAPALIVPIWIAAMFGRSAP